MEGDYLEFGGFYWKFILSRHKMFQKTEYLNPTVKKTRFYGFDSFSGFGEIKEDDEHSFYTDENFNTDFGKVEKRVKKVAKDTSFSLIPGFFNESLASGPDTFGIKKARIIFVDSDTYSSSREALTFAKK